MGENKEGAMREGGWGCAVLYWFLMRLVFTVWMDDCDPPPPHSAPHLSLWLDFRDGSDAV